MVRKIYKWLLCSLLYGMALFFACASREAGDLTHLVLDAPVTASAVEAIQQQERKEDDPVGFCFWGEQPNVRVTCPDTGGEALVTQLLLAGNPGLMDAEILAWQNGCLIDKATAQNLFGTTRCAGQALRWEEKAYPVLGTIDTGQPAMIFMSGASGQLDRLVLALPPEKGSLLAPSCMLRWDIQGSVLDHFLLWSIVSNCLLLLPGILGIRLLRSLAADLPLGGRGLRKLAWKGAVLAGLLWLLARQIVIPQNMIPSQWSDFSFWGRWWASEKTNFWRIVRTPLGVSQLQMAMDMVKSMIASTAACLALLWPTRRGPYADPDDRR